MFTINVKVSGLADAQARIDKLGASLLDFTAVPLEQA